MEIFLHSHPGPKDAAGAVVRTQKMYLLQVCEGRETLLLNFLTESIETA